LSLLAFIGQFLVAPHVATWFRQRRHAYKPVSSRSSDTSATLVGDETKPSLVGTEIKGLGYVQRSGGAGVVAWAVLKLIALVALEVLTIIAAVGAKGRRETVESWCLVSSVGYCAVLSLLSLTVRPSVVSAKTRALKAHLVTILAATWVIYFVRDIYPLATFTVPTQDPLTASLWVRLGLLTFAAVVAPLFSPRTHVPVSQPLGAYEPTAEQTASIIALLSYQYLDSFFKPGACRPCLSSSCHRSVKMTRRLTSGARCCQSSSRPRRSRVRRGIENDTSAGACSASFARSSSRPCFWRS
jgi:hypothetical protein